MAEIKITVEGPVGCGKSAIAGEIEIALRALGVPVRHADAAAAQSEKNMTHADWQTYLEMYEPTVVIEERIAAATPAPQQGETCPRCNLGPCLMGCEIGDAPLAALPAAPQEEG